MSFLRNPRLWNGRCGNKKASELGFELNVSIYAVGCGVWRVALCIIHTDHRPMGVFFPS